MTLSGGSTAITGWTVGGNSIDYIGSYWQAQDGSRSIDLAGSGNGSIAQTFATHIGTTYTVTYWIGRNPDGGANPRTGFVSAGGNQIAFSYDDVSSSKADMKWEQETFDFIATGTSTTLSFASDPLTSNGFYGPALDNVSISSAVPEPAAWALMLLGFGLVGGVLRRSKLNTALRFA